MRCLIALAAVLSPAIAYGQDFDLPFEAELPLMMEQRANRTDYLSVRLRATFIDEREAFRDVDGDSVDYGDLFNHGAGVSLEWGSLLRTGKDVWSGGYISIGGDLFAGGEHKVTSLGLTIEPDDLRIQSAIAGLRVMRWSLSGLSVEFYAGGGYAAYGSVDAKFAGVPDSEFEIYNRTGVGIGEGGLRFGMGTGSIAVQMGVGARVLRGPRFDSAFNDQDQAGTMMLGVADLSFNFSF